MNTVQRNWLIRTSQNQLLGPIAKSKLVEFIQKGALGLSDEVSSGNGYWFYIREKDLVEKYLLGDVPQSFNPISEAKSVYSRRENPDKTTSINASPANKTQFLKMVENQNAQIPKKEDLDFPDNDVTVVNNNINLNDLKKETVNKPNDEIKIPNKDDLEFPDIELVRKMESDHNQDLSSSPSISNGGAPKNTLDTNEILKKTNDDTPVLFPKDDDLEFPDLTPNVSSSHESKPMESSENELTFEVNIEQVAPLEEEKKIDVILKEVKKVESSEPKKIDSLEKDSPIVKKMGIVKKKELSSPELKLSREKYVSPTVDAPAPVYNGMRERPKKKSDQERELAPELNKRNDSYLFIILIVLIIIVMALVFYYYKFILNKPLPLR